MNDNLIYAQVMLASFNENNIPGINWTPMLETMDTETPDLFVLSEQEAHTVI